MLTEIAGIRVGHWTDPRARTGCTVVVFPEGTVASGEVRGGAPASRDFALLEPGRTVERLDAVVLSGGSAFGLAACDGVMKRLEADGVGFETRAGKVPIVVGLSLFDLGEGDATVRPGPAEGLAALEAADERPVELGAIGAAAGATVGKWRGADAARPGALVGAVAHTGEVIVAALVAVNAAGDVDDGHTTAEIMSGTFEAPTAEPLGEATTIGIVATNARLTKVQCHLVAQSAHDGYARALLPVHTAGDGDAVVVAATGTVDADVSLVRIITTSVVEAAIASMRRS